MENQDKKEIILQEFLKALESSRFNDFTLQSVAGSLEITSGELNLIFPNGLEDVPKELLKKHKNELQAGILEMEKTGITEGVKRSVLLSFELLNQHKKAVRKIFKFLISPKSIFLAPKFLYEISDTIWKSLGVNDSTFSFYSKRLILSTIYSNCFIYFCLSKNGEKLEKILSTQLSLLKKLNFKK